jgi:P22_AR N-terminal domain
MVAAVMYHPDTYQNGTCWGVAMADEPSPPRFTAPIYRDIKFDQDRLPAAIVHGDGVLLAIRHVCQVLGLDPKTQVDYLRSHPVFVAGLREVRVTIDGRLRTVAAIHQEYLAFWLATIHPNDVAEHLQPKLKRYQEELVGLLNTLYGPQLAPALVPVPSDVSAYPAPAAALLALHQRINELAIELRLAMEAERQQRRETTQNTEAITALQGIVADLQQQIAQHVPITPAQQQLIAQGVRSLAQRHKRKTGKELFGQLFAELCRSVGAPSYDKIPSGKYEQALDWIERKARQLFPDEPLPPRQERLL